MTTARKMWHESSGLTNKLVQFAILALAVFLLLVPQVVSALGFRIPNQDAEAIGRGNAFVATANNPSALYYNPSGITQLEGHNIQVGSLFYFGLISEYRAIGGSGRNAESEYEVLPVPEIYYTYTPEKSPLSLGLGIYSPFGLALKWPEDTSFRSQAIEGRLTYITINPVVAYQVHRTLSVAVGPTINYSDTKLRNGIGILPYDEFTFRGNDWDYGFNAGLRWQPLSQWSFGVSYRSATSLDYQGYSTATPAAIFGGYKDTSARIDFPQIVIAGVSYRPTPNWNLEVNIDWASWNSVDSVTFKGTALGDQTLKLDWHSSWLYEFGVTRSFSNGYYVSAGYFFCENTTSEKYFTPILPDTDLHVGSLGVGYKGKHWNIALAGQIIAGPWREIRNAQVSNVNGDYSWFSPTLSISTGFHF